MDVEIKRDIAQVELELQAITSYAGPSRLPCKGIDQHVEVTVLPHTERGRALSARSRAHHDLREINVQKRDLADALCDDVVCPTTDGEDNVSIHRTSSEGHFEGQTAPIQSNLSALHTAANSREGLDTLPVEPLANTSLCGGSGESSTPIFQSRPIEIPSFLAEALFIVICSTGQMLFGYLLGGVTTLQVVLIDRLGIAPSQAPWLQGAYLLANGLSVIVSGPLSDVIAPKKMICGAFALQALANLVGAFSLNNKYIFFCVRGAQGLSVGVLVSSSISVLGRVYKPGLRKTRVFSFMAGASPLGFWAGALQGGLLSKAPVYIFVMNTLLSSLCCATGLYAIPSVRPALANLSLRSFDIYGSTFAVIGCALLVAGLTQGPSAEWQAYTIVIVVLGLAALVAFFFVEKKVQRPLLPPALWRVPGFLALILSYFLGFGSFLAWQFYAVQFWLRVQNATPLQVAFYLTPNAIFGVLATFIVSRIAHLVNGHWILVASMLAFALGPVFFLPQSSTTTYWALSAPGIALVTFGPDLSFAAASIFVTSSVAKHYQGSAGSLLVTVQNLSGAIMTSLSDTIGERTADHTLADSRTSLKTFHSIWWFNFAASLLAAGITLVYVRIPKTVEKEHEE